MTNKKPLPPRTDGNTPKQRLATVSEACEYGRFGHTKCYDYISEGRIDAYKFDKRTFIDLDSIDRMRENSLVKVAPRREVK